jgi:hypothetical protein
LLIAPTPDARFRIFFDRNGAADRRRKSAIQRSRSLCPSRARARHPQSRVAVSGSSSVERRSVAEGVVAPADLAAYAATIRCRQDT